MNKQEGLVLRWWMSLALLVAITMMASCSSITHYAISDFKPGLNVLRHQDFWGTVYVTLALSEDGQRVMFPNTVPGSSPARLVGDVLGAAAVGGGMIYIGTQLPKINTGTSTVTVTGPEIP